MVFYFNVFRQHAVALAIIDARVFKIGQTEIWNTNRYFLNFNVVSGRVFDAEGSQKPFTASSCLQLDPSRDLFSVDSTLRRVPRNVQAPPRNVQAQPRYPKG